MTICAIWYHSYNFKKREKHPRRTVTFSKVAGNFTKSITPSWVFFTFFKLYKWYQIAQSISYDSTEDRCSCHLLSNFTLCLRKGSFYFIFRYHEMTKGNPSLRQDKNNALVPLAYCATYIIGFVCAILVLITHTLGIKLLYHAKIKARNQRSILISFSLFSIFTSVMLVIRGIYCFVYKNDEDKCANYYLYSNGIFIGLGLCYTLILFLLTMDRLIATLRPLKYFKYFRGGNCNKCLISVLITTTITALVFTCLNRRIQVYGYQIALAIITLLSIFMLITYIIIFYKLRHRKVPRFSCRTNNGMNSKGKIMVPFSINLVLIFFHVIPHILAMKYHNRFCYFQLAGLLLLITSLGLLLDAIIYIFVLRNTQRALGRGLGKLEESMKRTTNTVRRRSLSFTNNNVYVVSRKQITRSSSA